MGAGEGALGLRYRSTGGGDHVKKDNLACGGELGLFLAHVSLKHRLGAEGRRESHGRTVSFFFMPRSSSGTGRNCEKSITFASIFYY